MTGWLKSYRVWLSAQPVVVAVTKPQELRGRDLGQTVVQIFVPILAFVLVVGGGIGAALKSPQPTVGTGEELTSQKIEAVGTSELEVAELEVFELEDFEPEEYHSVAQYAANLEQYREGISSLRPFKHWQRNRQAQILSSLEVREWVAVGTVSSEVCFQHSETLQCIESETLETLRESGKEFAEANPTGFGLCYDWFDDVCLSGDWFDSKDRFTSVINATRHFVMTGEWPVEAAEQALESSPAYEPTATAVELQPGTLEWLDAQGQPTSRVFKEAQSGGLDGCFDPKTGEACSQDELLVYAKQSNDRWEEENPEGFSVCYSWEQGVCMSGEAFSSEAAYEEAMKEIEEYQRAQEESASEPAPDDSVSEPAPDDSGSEPAPDDSGSEPAPDDSGSEPAPDDSGD